MTSASDPDGMELVLRAAFRDAARGVQPSGGTGHMVAARHRRRRRRQAIAASTAAVLLVMAGTVAIPKVVSRAGGHVVQPVSPPKARALDVMDGVVVTWLPPGARRIQHRPTSGAGWGGAAGLEDRYIDGPSTTSPAAHPSTADLPEYGIMVGRGVTADFPEIRRTYTRQRRAAIPGTTVHGLPALLVASAPGSGTSPGYIATMWNEQGVALGVWTEGGTRAETTRIAEGLVVGAAPAGPADMAAARRAVDAAVLQAFDGASPDGLAAVQDGESLRAVLNLANAANPPLIREMGVDTLGAVRFTSRTEAVVQFRIRMPLIQMKHVATQVFGGGVVAILTPAGWKVSHETFCESVAAVVVCPSR